MINTPIAYIVFNRPQHTATTFEVLRQQRPSKLFIIADGPRTSHPTDVEKCAAVREIVSKVDWPCEVYRNYSDTNLGLKRRVSSGLDWVFQNVEQAIVLEDDCVAHPDFFTFCESLLDKYANDERISVITGNNFQDGQKRGDASYYFSKFNHCWGWATWRRAWAHYDGNIGFWPEWSKSATWSNLNADPIERQHWENVFDMVLKQQIDSWAFPWTASVWFCGGLTATPNVNLVTNIGFGEDATHTKSVRSKQAHMAVSPIGPLIYCNEVKRDTIADAYTFNYNFGGRNLRFPRSILSTLRTFAKYVYNVARGIYQRGSH